MGRIVYLPVSTRLPIPAERVLQSAIDAGLTDVIVIGVTPAGDPYYAASGTDAPEMLWRVERFKQLLLDQTPEGAR